MRQVRRESTDLPVWPLTLLYQARNTSPACCHSTTPQLHSIATHKHGYKNMIGKLVIPWRHITVRREYWLVLYLYFVHRIYKKKHTHKLDCFKGHCFLLDLYIVSHIELVSIYFFTLANTYECINGLVRSDVQIFKCSLDKAAHKPNWWEFLFRSAYDWRSCKMCGTMFYPIVVERGCEVSGRPGLPDGVTESPAPAGCGDCRYRYTRTASAGAPGN